MSVVQTLADSVLRIRPTKAQNLLRQQRVGIHPIFIAPADDETLQQVQAWWWIHLLLSRAGVTGAETNMPVDHMLEKLNQYTCFTRLWNRTSQSNQARVPFPVLRLGSSKLC